jgi:hypothetical protein
MYPQLEDHYYRCLGGRTLQAKKIFAIAGNPTKTTPSSLIQAALN